MSGPGDVLAALKGRFLERCRGDLQALDAIVADPAQIGGEEARMLVHRLSGAAGTFGYPQVSEIAGGLDDAFHDGRPVLAEDLSRLAEAVRAMVA